MKVVDKMTVVAYKFLWVLLHYAYTLVRLIQWLSKWLHDWFLSITTPRPVLSIDEERKLIEEHVGCMKKLPRHLSINVGIEEPNFLILSRVIYWALSAGIEVVSFYDYKGSIKENHRSLSYQMAACYNRKEVVLHWEHDENTGDCYGSVNYQNGMRKKIKVHVHDATDGKSKIAAICKQICTDQEFKADSLTVDSMDLIIQREYGNMIDPELCFCIGEFFCTYGMPPWQLRLTEFYKISDQRSLDVYTFLDGLSVYAKCEQRVGR